TNSPVAAMVRGKRRHIRIELAPSIRWGNKKEILPIRRKPQIHGREMLDPNLIYFVRGLASRSMKYDTVIEENSQVVIS
ncbi:MAG: hypothetical protein M1493_05615, partial [Firmicutes bacterium]|nr:hypothetical protein [Bacillota bacterium]